MCASAEELQAWAQHLIFVKECVEDKDSEPRSPSGSIPEGKAFREEDVSATLNEIIAKFQETYPALETKRLRSLRGLSSASSLDRIMQQFWVKPSAIMACEGGCSKESCVRTRIVVVLSLLLEVRVTILDIFSALKQKGMVTKEIYYDPYFSAMVLMLGELEELWASIQLSSPDSKSVRSASVPAASDEKSVLQSSSRVAPNCVLVESEQLTWEAQICVSLFEERMMVFSPSDVRQLYLRCPQLQTLRSSALAFQREGADVYKEFTSVFYVSDLLGRAAILALPKTNLRHVFLSTVTSVLMCARGLVWAHLQANGVDLSTLCSQMC